MWYVGFRTENGGGKIGYATSPDGIIWTKHPAPVLEPGGSRSWDSYTVELGSVIWSGSLYLMWYAGGPFGSSPVAVGLATSPDGISWSKYPGNPVMRRYSGGVAMREMTSQAFLKYPYVISVDGAYKMWYAQGTGTSSSSIFYASSNDGVSWMKRSSPVLTPSSNLQDWDAVAVYCPTVIYDGSTYWMWFSGGDPPSMAISPGQVFASTPVWLTGYATSNDGLSWTKYAGNPILRLGPSGSWDSYDSLDNQGVVLVDNRVMLYYSAAQVVSGKEVSYNIGLATPPEDFAIPEMSSEAPILLLEVLLLTVTVIVRSPKGFKISCGPEPGQPKMSARRLK
jgi:predicted GH43/DUF377 family glycosyl hydrolase